MKSPTAIEEAYVAGFGARVPSLLWIWGMILTLSGVGWVAHSPALAANPTTSAAGPEKQDGPSKKATHRADQLKANLKHFSLALRYSGDSDKPFYEVHLSVAPSPAPAGDNPFSLFAQITELQASKIIDHLTSDGFMDQAASLTDSKFIPAATSPGYSMMVSGYYIDLGWKMPMLARLDGLRSVLEGDASKSLDFVLSRLGGYRKLWQNGK